MRHCMWRIYIRSHWCPIIQAELRDIYHVLRLALARGFNRIVIESDSLLAISLISQGCACQHSSRQLAQEVTWNHVLREVNSVADSFARFGLSLDNDVRIFVSPLSFVDVTSLANASRAWAQH
ncbi:putative ribonuclease H protein [Spatholobus suberectus]|nr:putative ribonuclease H protein [Spatholobus suberectus]